MDPALLGPNGGTLSGGSGGGDGECAEFALKNVIISKNGISTFIRIQFLG